MINLSTIKPDKGSTKKRKVVGRGNASGHGTYSCRGMKGQKARSGVSGLKRLGMKSKILQIPKLRGFKSKRPSAQVLNLNDLNETFKAGEIVSRETLTKRGLVKISKAPIKILADGELKVKDLKFSGLKISQSALTKIKAVNGSVGE